jgi:hypothetical protein
MWARTVQALGPDGSPFLLFNNFILFFMGIYSEILNNSVDFCIFRVHLYP